MNMYGKLLELLNGTEELKASIEEIKADEASNISLQFTAQNILEFLCSSKTRIETLEQMVIALEETSEKKNAINDLIEYVKMLSADYDIFLNIIRKDFE